MKTEQNKTKPEKPDLKIEAGGAELKTKDRQAQKDSKTSRQTITYF